MHLELTPKQSAALSKLGQDIGTATKVETIRMAIDVLTHVVQGVSTGSKLILRSADGKECEIILIPLIPRLPHKQE